jgi:hypothetical protein
MRAASSRPTAVQQPMVPAQPHVACAQARRRGSAASGTGGGSGCTTPGSGGSGGGRSDATSRRRPAQVWDTAGLTSSEQRRGDEGGRRWRREADGGDLRREWRGEWRAEAGGGQRKSGGASVETATAHGGTAHLAWRGQAAVAHGVPTGGPHTSALFQNKINPNSVFHPRKIYRQFAKIQKKSWK